MGYHNRRSPDHSRPQPRTATNGHTAPRQRAERSSTGRGYGQHHEGPRPSGKAFYLIFLAALAMALYALAH